MKTGQLTRDDVLAILRETGTAGEPVTAQEPANQLDCPLDTVVERLDQLRNQERIRSKELHGGRVWWTEQSPDKVDVEAFAGLMAHEVRNPLSIAKIYLQHLDGDEDARDEVETALDRIEDMTDVLVTTSGSTGSVDPDPVNVAEIAGEVQSAVGFPSDCLEVEDGLLVEAEPQHLQYMLEHLCENAVRHSDGDVTICVETHEGQTGFYVEDDGPGIPESERDQVFQPGYTTTENGWGLGLTVVNQLARTYEWDCEVTEGATVGTRVRFDNVAGLSTETATY